MSEKKKDEEGLKIYARVRTLMPWEPKKISLQVNGEMVRNKCGKIVNEYGFSRVFKPASTNEQVFQSVAMPMIGNVMKGFNAVLIAYGQTGSGKTFSMLGKPKLNVVGLLPQMLSFLVKQPKVLKVELTAVEAFGHHVAKIALYDLFDPWNQVPDWAEKKGGQLALDKCTHVPVGSADEAHDRIIYAHAASHFAPTGKNPESSRGHVTFIAHVHQTMGDNQTLVSYFVMVDCAGSEGDSAFTPEFKASVTKEVLTCRRLEAGVINTGLSQLQVIFNQLRTRGALSKSVGNGLRKVLHPYINNRTFLSVLFCLSPSVNNAKATESTLKFAVTAGMVKVKPVKQAGKTNFDKLAKELKAHLEMQEKVIEENTDKIEDLERQYARMQKAIEDGKSGLGRKIVTKKVLRVNAETGQQEEVTMEVYDDAAIDATLEKQMDEDKKEAAAQSTSGTNKAEKKESVESMISSDAAVLLAQMDKKYANQFKEIDTNDAAAVAEANRKAQEEIEKKLNSFNMQWQREAYVKKIQKAKVGAEKAKKAKMKKQDSGLERVQRELEKAQSQFRALEKEQNEVMKKIKDPAYAMQKNELEAHAMKLYVMQAEQKNATEQLELAKNTIIQFLYDDGREALIKFFTVRGIIKKKLENKEK